MGEIRDILRDNLEYLFAKSGMTRKQISAKLDVSPSSLTNWTKGDNSPDIETIAVICKLFNISVVDLFENDLRNNKKRTPSDESVSQTNTYTPHEQKVIEAYRAKPNMHEAVDRLLEVEPEQPFDVGEDIKNSTEAIEAMVKLRRNNTKS